ncbi:MAG: hypothetical protein NT075_04845 [Chloroflexi bacterium]|nr:hypothetical protein [Chloroflexota bacterium]
MNQVFGAKFDPKWIGDISLEAALTYLYAVKMTLKQDHARGLAALNDLFRTGDSPTQPLHGHYTGELIALDIAPVLTPIGQKLTAWWMPWLGKTFDATQACGDNLFAHRSLPLARLCFPRYRRFVHENAQIYRAFAFRTWIGPGKTDPDRQVLKIDYNLAENPRATVRRVLDELVQVAKGFYLGKAHLHWWWGQWQMVAYFTLRHEMR